MIRFLPTTSPFLQCFRWLTSHFEGNHNIFLSDTILLKTQKFEIFMNMPSLGTYTYHEVLFNKEKEDEDKDEEEKEEDHDMTIQ